MTRTILADGRIGYAAGADKKQYVRPFYAKLHDEKNPLESRPDTRTTTRCVVCGKRKCTCAGNENIPSVSIHKNAGMAACTILAAAMR